MTEELENLEEDNLDLDDDMEPDLVDDDDLSSIDDDEDDVISPSKRKKDDYSEDLVETALQANPKRAQARRKAVNLIEGLVNQNELETDDGKLRAWNVLKERAEKSALPPKSYAIDAYLIDGDFIEHSIFGEGFVIESLSPTKVNVLFEDGLRKLVCNYKR